MLCTGIDYACDHVSWAGPPPNGHGPLDTKYAFEMMVDLAQQCGAEVYTLWNEQMTKESVRHAIGQVGQMAGPEDWFIFYYTGHGDELAQDDSGESEAKDQCLCLVDAQGSTDGNPPNEQIRDQIWLRDEDFAKDILDAVSAEAKILILLDCCHSETMLDLGKGTEWANRNQRVISICGCQDKQTSQGTGKGGMFTQAMVESIEELQQSRGQYNISALYNAALDNYLQHMRAGHSQNISMHGMVKYPNEEAWPLIPLGPYQAPARWWQ